MAYEYLIMQTFIYMKMTRIMAYIKTDYNLSAITLDTSANTFSTVVV